MASLATVSSGRRSRDGVFSKYNYEHMESTNKSTDKNICCGMIYFGVCYQSRFRASTYDQAATVAIGGACKKKSRALEELTMRVDAE